MLHSLISVPNLCWHGRDFFPCGFPVAENVRWNDHNELTGRFAVAQRIGDKVVLSRDSLGLNKLFFAIHKDDGVVVSNYLTDLIDNGVPFEAIHAVPAASVTEIAPRHRVLRSQRFRALNRRVSAQPCAFAAARCELEAYFERLSRQFPAAEAAVCLSGGLDSALVAAIAREHFPAITAYTYSFTDGGGQSDDVSLARQTAIHLRIPWRLARAGPDEVLSALRDAVVFGQDWRDFNAHCAIVNVLLADAIAQDAQKIPGATAGLVLTGDLMNELLGDYAPVRYAGKEYYPLPPIRDRALRRALVRGIQAGDREVGVFQSRGLTVAQPYAAIVDSVLSLPDTTTKPAVIKALAGDRLPEAFYGRRKARAQIGDSEVRRGILPLLADSGRDAEWLERFACKLFGAPDQRSLRNFIRAGAYRSCPRFPERRCGQSGYLAL
jgi:Asparagine synthase